MRVVFADEATDDLEEIADFIAQDSARYARLTVKELRAKAKALSPMPEKFPVFVQRGHVVLRRRPYGEYVIFYYIVPGKRIVIARILHSARDHERILFPEN